MKLIVLVATAGLVGQHPQTPKVDASATDLRQLVAGLAEAKTADHAQQELLRIGTPAVRPLVAVVIDDGVVSSSAHGKRALRVLGRMGPRAAHAFPDLAAALAACKDEIYFDLLHTLAGILPYREQDRDPHFAEQLVFSNRELSRRYSTGNDRQRFQYEFNRLQQRTLVDPKAGLRAMIEELHRNRTHRREVAAEVVGRMGPAAADAVEALAGSMRKGAPVVGQIGGFSVPKYRDEFPRAASEAMIAIAPHDPRTAIAWGWQLGNARDEQRRMTAALRIGSFGVQAREQVDGLVDALRDESLSVRQEAVTALGMIGPSARPATRALQRIAAGPNKGLAARAAAALQAIGAK